MSTGTEQPLQVPLPLLHAVDSLRNLSVFKAFGPVFIPVHDANLQRCAARLVPQQRSDVPADSDNSSPVNPRDRSELAGRLTRYSVR